MSSEGKKLHNALRQRFDGSHKKRLCDIYHSFRKCSEDDSNGRQLVSSEVQAINFDKLTKWLSTGNKPQSADSLTFRDDDIYLIEFKAGNQVEHDNRIKALIENVSGKINDSADTLYNQIFPLVCDLDKRKTRIRFYLVADSDAMGIDPMMSILAKLALGEVGLPNPNDQKLFQQVLPNLKSNAKYPERFEDIDIWYSAWFDRYIENHRIKDIREIV